MKSSMKRILALLAALCVLLGCVWSAGAENNGRLSDKAGVLSGAEEARLGDELAAMNDAYAADIAVVTVKNTGKKSARDYSADLISGNGWGRGESKSALLLLIDTGKDDFWLQANGGAAKVFTGSVISALKSDAYFPVYFAYGEYANGIGDYLGEVRRLLDAWNEALECEITGISVTSAGGAQDRISVSVTLTNWSDDTVKLAENLSGTLTVKDKEYTAALSFPYKSVYSAETLDGTLDFTVPKQASWGKNSFEARIVCRLASLTADAEEAKDLRSANEKKVSSAPASSGVKVEKNGTYSSKEEVAAYIRAFGKLPSNYITKNQAEALGWVSTKGNLWNVAPGCSIGGDRFGNYEGVLPDGNYTECDIDFRGGTRNSKRLVFCKSGGTWHIYYTEDHYNTFEEVK